MAARAIEPAQEVLSPAERERGQVEPGAAQPSVCSTRSSTSLWSSSSLIRAFINVPAFFCSEGQALGAHLDQFSVGPPA